MTNLKNVQLNRMLSFFFLLYCAVFLGACAATPHTEEYVITIRDHQFSPEELVVPANHKVKVTLRNLDSKKALFRSFDLSREKRIGPGTEEVIFLGPLKSGSYAYHDYFNTAAKGVVTVK